MNIADLPESRKFMERINTWFYKTKERNPTTNVRDILKNLNVLSDHIQLNSVMGEFCFIYIFVPKFSLPDNFLIFRFKSLYFVRRHKHVNSANLQFRCKCAIFGLQHH